MNIAAATHADHPAALGPQRLSARGISFSYGGVAALQQVDLHVHAGEVVGLVGPNGSGKTTLLRVMAGHLPRAEGQVLLDGGDVLGRMPSRIAATGLAYLHQHPRLFTDLTVRENLRVAGRKEGPADWLDQMLELTGLTEYANSYPTVLSHGQARLLQIARTFAPRPTIALLDEPASGVNPRIRSIVADLLGRVAGQGSAIVVVEHDMAFVRRACQRIYVLDAGRVIAHGSPSQALEESTVIAAYFG